MRIGMLGSIWLNTPPKAYGGTEDVIYNLTNSLVEKGHDVTLFGPKTAKVKAKVHPTVPLPLRENKIAWSNIGYTLLHITQAFDRAEKFDILHIHINKAQDFIALPLSMHSKTPVLFTLHFDLPGKKSSVIDRYQVLEKYSHLPFTSISHSQRKPLALNYVATVYNGVDIERFPYSNRKGAYLAWLGKVNPLKGTKEAIIAAKKAGLKIYVMGVIENGVPEMLSYYENEVKPLIDDEHAVWLGEVSHNEKTSILSGARAFLNPIQWEEPFGLVMAEAQAVGTPVISFRRGSAYELIVDGKTGFLVDTVAQMVKKIQEAEFLDRADCRKNVVERFTVETMTHGYEQAYEIVRKNWEHYKRAKND